MGSQLAGSRIVGVAPEAAHTDLRNAERFAAANHPLLVWVPEWAEWVKWVGNRWTRKAQMLANRAAREMIVQLRGTMGNQAARVESWSTHQSILSYAKDMLEASADDFDANPWAINCANGQLDLHSFVLTPHNPQQKNTKLSPIAWDPAADQSVWLTYLTRVVPDEPTRAFLQRAVGYSLTGSVEERVVLFLTGDTTTGKSTFVEAIAHTLGDYAMASDFKTFLRNEKAVRNDIARLEGARFVSAVEVPPDQQFDEGLIKALTGRDRITARLLHREYRTYTPQFKIWFAANHRPNIHDDDNAIWRRLLLVPFEQRITEEDKKLPELLRANAAGILAWAVEGCRLWQRDGLGVPPLVAEATAAYRDESATFQHFVTECLERGPEWWTAARDVLNAHRVWATDEGYTKHLGPKGIAERLRGCGFRPERRGQVRGWRGLKIRLTPPAPAPQG